MKAIAALILFAMAGGCASSVTQEDINRATFEWMATLHALIKSNWVPPPRDANTPSSCRIYLTLDPTGAVKSAEIKQPCISDGLEQSIRHAVMQSSPFPLPKNPAAFNEYIVLNFVLPHDGA